MPPTVQELISKAESLLADAWGEENAITIEQLAFGLALPNRRACEDFLEHHVADFSFLVCSLSRCGYFRPRRASELNDTLASLRRRALKVFVRRRTLIRRAMAEQRFERRGKEFSDPPAVQREFSMIV